MRVVTGGECYHCWAKRRRDHKGLDQASLNKKREGSKKFKDDHDRGRGDMARGGRTAFKGGDRLDESKTVKGEKGVFGKNYDEGHFFFLDLMTFCSSITKAGSSAPRLINSERSKH